MALTLLTHASNPHARKSITSLLSHTATNNPTAATRPLLARMLADLLACGMTCNPKCAPDSPLPLLVEACMFSHARKPVFDVLIESGIDLDAQDGGGRTAIHLCVLSSNVPFLARLLEAGANPNVGSLSRCCWPPASIRAPSTNLTRFSAWPRPRTWSLCSTPMVSVKPTRTSTSDHQRHEPLGRHKRLDTHMNKSSRKPCPLALTLTLLEGWLPDNPFVDVDNIDWTVFDAITKRPHNRLTEDLVRAVTDAGYSFERFRSHPSTMHYAPRT